MTRSIISALILIAAFAVSPPVDAQTSEYDRLRAMELDGRSVELTEYELKRDVFTFNLIGHAHLLKPVAGKEWGFVFLGSGSMLLEPATESELHQLRIRTGEMTRTDLNDTFQAAIFYATDGLIEQLIASGTTSTITPPAAKTTIDQFMKRQRKDFATNFQVRVLQDLLSAADRPGFFTALMNTRKLPTSVAVVDPLGAGSMFGAQHFGPEESALVVDWSSPSGGRWYSAHTTDELTKGTDAECRSHQIFDADHYSIATTIKRNEDTEGTTTITFRPLTDGERVLPITIAPEIRIASAELVDKESSSTTPLAVIQEGKDADPDAAIVFPQPLNAEESYQVRLSYAGDESITEVGFNYFVVLDRSTWYPNLGSFTDSALFDLEFRTVGNKTQVVSVGRLVSDVQEGDIHITRWTSDKPVRVAGFNFGQFAVDKEVDEVSGLEIEMYTPTTRGALTGSKDNVMVDALNSARLFSTVFGPLSFPRVAVTQQPQFSSGQAWPTLVYLPAASFVNESALGIVGMHGMSSFIDAVGAHEMAHQWWGHEIGWGSYRDQWLSEGFASFSANYFIQRTQDWAAHDKIYKEAQEFITKKIDSYKNYQVGPVTTGTRLSTSRSESGYRVLVYEKGSFIVHMLRMLMMDTRSKNPDDRFFIMLRDFIETHRGQSPTTEDFKASVEKHIVPELDAHGNGSVDWFFDQWVYGMEIPRIDSELSVSASGDQWKITGTVTQSGVSENFLTLVPLYVEFGKGELFLIGRLPMRGETTQRVDRKMAMPKKPRRILINAHHDVLSMSETKKRKGK